MISWHGCNNSLSSSASKLCFMKCYRSIIADSSRVLGLCVWGRRNSAWTHQCLCHKLKSRLSWNRLPITRHQWQRWKYGQLFAILICQMSISWKNVMTWFFYFFLSIEQMSLSFFPVIVFMTLPPNTACCFKSYTYFYFCYFYVKFHGRSTLDQDQGCLGSGHVVY